MTLLALLLLSILAIAGCGGQREGSVRYADCREIIPLSQDDFNRQKIGTTFTCSYTRDANNRVVGGECVAVKTEGSGCTEAYVYTFPTISPCPSPHEVHTKAGICECEPGYTVDPSATKCVPITQQ